MKMDLRAQHEDATEVNEWIKFGMRIAVSINSMVVIEGLEIQFFFFVCIQVGSTLHPFEYAKVLMQVLCTLIRSLFFILSITCSSFLISGFPFNLIQLGYEPIAPRPGRSLFGSPVLILPNVFQYGKLMRIQNELPSMTTVGNNIRKHVLFKSSF